MRRFRPSQAALAALLVAAVLLGGCSAVRVSVTDAESGAPIAGATLSVRDASGQLLERTRSGPDGGAGLGVSPSGTLLAVVAAGYAAAGVAWPPTDALRPIPVALEPRAIADFRDAGGVAMPLTIHVNRHCPCLDPVEGTPGK